jgi:hypothetical protein
LESVRGGYPGVTDTTDCGFAANPRFMEHGRRSEPLCPTYHNGQQK